MRTSSRWAAIAAVAAAYFFFLIFAEFAFLDLAERNATGTTMLRGLLAALGTSGICGAIAAAVGCRASTAARWLSWAFRGCALGGTLALLASSPIFLLPAAVLAGASLGALTVTLAASLRDAVGDSRLGVCIGAGTGAAYAVCNLPWVFHAAPATQTLLAIVAVAAASFLSTSIARAQPQLAPDPVDKAALARWIAVLLALVWLDSAAFYIVQHTDSLRASTWTESTTLFGNAGVHLIAALLAGLWLDRGHRAIVAALALACLTMAALVLNGTLPLRLPAHWFYTAGVSLYSVVLVEFPARSGRPGIGAWVFAIAGWAGSALGIGMAQDLAEIPAGFVATASVVALFALPWRRRWVHAALVVILGASLARADEVGFGREVYIAEGCIHCHSQFIRPRVASEVLNWGPAAPLAEALGATPPLFGTRRQGPDLSHVGNRRSPEWNRLHLVAPQKISPGSRMPSYAHLFKKNDSRGPALIAYLASLGADSVAWRQARAAEWTPIARDVITPEAAADLFSRLCAHCHGRQGRGNGELAERLSLRPPDWSAQPWRRVSPEDNVDVALARIIKFGLPGSPMAGHEYLPDAEIVGLAHYVRTLHKDNGSRLQAAVQP